MPNNYNTLESNKIVCEAIDCLSFATQEIKVSAGKFGTISLNLCNNCVNLFKEEGDKLIEL
jgi:hypothetical protein